MYRRMRRILIGADVNHSAGEEKYEGIHLHCEPRFGVLADSRVFEKMQQKQIKTPMNTLDNRGDLKHWFVD